MGQLEVTFISSFDSHSVIGLEARGWDQIRAAKGGSASAKAAAYKVLGWKLGRAGWKDDSARLEKVAGRLVDSLPPWVEPRGMSKVLSLTASAAEDHSDVLQNTGGLDKIQLMRLLSHMYPRVCEIGFHRGVTALSLLDAGASVYTGFELSSNEVSHSAASYISSIYEDRFEMVWGNSLHVVPQQARAGRECDLIFIDIR